MSFSKVSASELDKIFKNNDSRSDFIAHYSHFGDDGNDEYYRKFIDNNIAGKKYKYQEHAIELSLATNHFDIFYLDVVRKIIHSRRTSWIKLLCLDWLNYFTSDIPTEEHISLNYFAKKSNDEFLKLQSILNLIRSDPKPELIGESFEILRNTTTPTLYYRYLNHITNIDNNAITILSNDSIEKLGEIISMNKVINNNQRADLEKKLIAYLAVVNG